MSSVNSNNLVVTFDVVMFVIIIHIIVEVQVFLYSIVAFLDVLCFMQVPQGSVYTYTVLLVIVTSAARQVTSAMQCSDS